ncbi:MAG: hypothetical protein CR964_00310 [Rhodobacterales bacterium]|nr:MAG: hypothetical protein CR964_00310 [Rhodobacterales bacterium]
MKLFTKFFKDDSGAVTVDWVVLTAAIVGLGIAVMTTVSGGTNKLAETISNDLSSKSIMTHGSSSSTTTTTTTGNGT